MLLRAFRAQPLSHKPHFRALQSLAPLCAAAAARPFSSNDAVSDVSALIKKPNWEKSARLETLASHLSPHSVSRVIAAHSGDIPLCLTFLKWVCQKSTYCYDLDSRIQLLKTMASDNLWGVSHKVLIFLIKECCTSQDDLLKLIHAIEEMRENLGFRINYPCYSVLLMRLAKLDLGLIAFSVFNRMLEDGFVAGEIDYMALVNALCKNGFVLAAEMFVSTVVKLGFALDVRLCTSLVLGNCRAREVDEAFKVFAVMSGEGGCGVNSVTYTILVHGLCEEGRLDELTCDRGLMDRAFGLLDEMMREGCKPNVYTYTVLVDTLCREGRVQEANGMFRKMLGDGLSPSVVTYNALINSYCKEGRVVLAFELLGLMERRRCKPNIRTYNELMEGLCNIGRSHKAVELLRKAINNGLFPSKVTFNILISGFCRLGQLGMALEILHSMSSIGVEPDQFSYTAFIDSLCKMGRPEQACVFLGLIVKKDVPVDEVTLTALIHGYCKTGSSRYAIMLLERMVGDRCLASPHAFNVFLDVLDREGKLVEGDAMLGKMLKHGSVPSVVTYTLLVDGLCRAGDTAACLVMLERMKEAGCPPNVYTYTTAINGLCQRGEFEGAENLVVEMSRAGVSPNAVTYGLLVKSYVAARRLDRAFELVRTMFEEGCRPSNQTYTALLAGILALEAADCDGAGEFGGDEHKPSHLLFMEIGISHAWLLLRRITDCGGDPSDASGFLITGLTGAGRISEAGVLIQQMVSSGLALDSDACASMITQLCRRDEHVRALAWIRRLVAYGHDPSLGAVSSVIVGLRKEGRIQEAESLISEVVRNAGVEDQAVILPYIGFLVKGEEESCHFHEILDLIEQMGSKERPIL
ncbi:pentatricopeptide repeat-containing protein At3g07290, mitochondrial-like [Salvia miltiorrhiza]|uniref:pentatricopeptide repeat-containing protein At3g07290, mitochondrial-like n=1 Tax=Salvia miltiorrhiza TaxID=226208 RepID=UPI0025AC0E86|nr:pentatricopeptide repeat-containing protein At3g07290, mitochondrial-like [Salvia miltiorrhiza]